MTSGKQHSPSYTHTHFLNIYFKPHKLTCYASFKGRINENLLVGELHIERERDFMRSVSSSDLSPGSPPNLVPSSTAAHRTPRSRLAKTATATGGPVRPRPSPLTRNTRVPRPLSPPPSTRPWMCPSPEPGPGLRAPH